MTHYYRIPPRILRTETTTQVKNINNSWFYEHEEVVFLDTIQDNIKNNEYTGDSAIDLVESLKEVMASFNGGITDMTTDSDKISITGYSSVQDYDIEKIDHYLANINDYEAERTAAIHKVAVLLEQFPEILESEHKYKLANERYEVKTNMAFAASLKGSQKN
jgi:hypothetical protein